MERKLLSRKLARPVLCASLLAILFVKCDSGCWLAAVPRVLVLQIQSCCGAAKICGDGLQQKSCCNALQSCCGGRECCNTGIGANPVQFCTDNSFTGPPANQLRCCLPNFVNCNGTCCQTRNNPATQVCLLDTRGVATCCNTQSLCTSPSDGSQQCCTSQQTCTRNITTTGQQIAACCTPGQSLCPKNAFQPICCAAGKCPSPSTAETCLQ